MVGVRNEDRNRRVHHRQLLRFAMTRQTWLTSNKFGANKFMSSRMEGDRIYFRVALVATVGPWKTTIEHRGK